MSALAILLIAHAPTMRAAAERLKAEQTDEENRMFCQKFHMASDTESFATCVGYLTEIRRRHGERLAAEAAGIL